MTFAGEEMRSMGGRFVIEREVGRGGVGIVYQAWDRITEQHVALKVIAAEAGVSPEEEGRLAREGEVLSHLDHPGIVRVVAHGVMEESSLPFIAMEWLDGEDLAARQKRAPLNISQSIELAIRVSEALVAAHDAGVIHRDIKPGNILLCRREAEPGELDFYPKLVDFGVAAAQDVRITRTGDVVGTPAYMAPEQARGDAPIDARADIYSLGATLFELIAGRPPHVGPTAIATLARLVTTPPPRLSELRIETPPQLDALVQRLLATDPEHRPQTMPEVIEALEQAKHDFGRVSWPVAVHGEPSLSTRLGSSASRLVTSIVAIRFATSLARDRALELLRQRDADAVPLGPDSIVAHLGARRAVGSEAAVALEVGLRLAQAGARVGIASGRARVNMLGFNSEAQPVGEVVDRASALARDADQGTVVADATTSELGRGGFEFRARDDGSCIVGEQLRGAEPERAAGAPFVGREPEMAQVLSAFDRARGDSTPILVTVTGPPGIGKSRLRREVLARISAGPSKPVVVVQRSEAYARGHALGAASDVLRALIGLPKGASAREAEDAIVGRLGPSTRSELTTKNREILARLFANEPLPEGIDPRGARDVLWLAMTDMVLQVASQEPTILVMEDLQWADPESIGWLDHMLGRSANRPLMVIALVRPAFWQEQPSRFAGRDHVRLELRPISKRASRAIARALLGEKAGDDMLDRIADQAAGLPLFAEELARLAATNRVPVNAPTIEAVIQVSLDSLDDEGRDAVGRLSVFGLSCWDGGLEALGIKDVQPVMKSLTAAEILMEQNVSRFPGSREWIFKHALVRDVAYSSLGELERKELHALAASWLAGMGEDAATVAGHFDLGDQHLAGADHWARAAQRALATNALSDALNMAERALTFAMDKPSAFLRASYLDEAWSRLDPRASERETAVSALEENVYDEASAVRARGARARYDDARGVGHDITARLAETRDEAAALGLHDEEARCSAALAMRLAFAGRFAEAEAEAARLLTFAESRNISAAAVDAWQTLAIVRHTQGAVTSALEARRSAVKAARAGGLKEREAMLMTNLGFALTSIGARQEARGALETGLALADAIGSSGAVRHAQMNLLGWAATFGNDKQLEGHLAEARTEADSTATGMWAAPDRANLGVLFYRGMELLRPQNEASCKRAAALLRMATEGYRATGNRDILPAALGMWSEAERRCGNAERAVALAREAAELLESGAPSLLNESAVYLPLHDAYVALGNLDNAREAVAHGLKPLEKRLQGLLGTAYAKLFLTELPTNAGLLAAAEGLGLVPERIHRLLASS